MTRPLPRLFLGLESLETVNSGIGRVAWLVARVVADEMQTGRLTARGISLSDRTIPGDFPLPGRGAGKSRCRYVAAITWAHLSQTHFFYDFLGMARAHGWLPFLRRPFLTIVHGVEAWPGPWERADRIRVAGHATMLVTNSAYTRTRACLLDPTFARAKVCCLATLDDSLPDRPHTGHESPRVLILGRMDEMAYKGHKELIECWPKVVAAVPDATLTVAGDGTKLGDYRQLAGRSPVASRIEFVGLVPPEQLEALWSRTSVFAMPSRGEGFGIVYIEAMRQGIPVIASVHDAAGEININGRTGYNVDLEQPDELPDRLIQLLKDRDHAARLGSNGQKRWREHFRYSAFRDRFRPLLREFLES